MGSLRPRQEVFTRNIAKLIEHIFSIGMTCTFGDAFRSEEQAKLNAEKGVGIKNSLHCIRLAVDLNLFDSAGKYLKECTPDYTSVGQYWESLHADNRWGGFFNTKYHGRAADPNHYEMKDM
jgi:hypothetical protein